MDPVHAVFLHTRVVGAQLTEAWGAMPEYDFRPTPNGMMYITAVSLSSRIQGKQRPSFHPVRGPVVRAGRRRKRGPPSQDRSPRSPRIRRSEAWLHIDAHYCKVESPTSCRNHDTRTENSRHHEA